MNDPHFTFEESGIRYSKSYSFFSDHIDCEWSAGFRKGKERYPVSDISGEFSEQTTFAFGLKGVVRSLVIYLVIGLVLHLGFDHSLLRYIGFIFYALAALGAGYAVTKLRSDTWIYVKTRAGRSLFSIRVQGLKEIDRSEFEHEIQQYSKEANQPPQTRATSGPA